MSMIGYKSENHPQQTALRGALDEVDDRGTDQTFFDSLSKRFGGFTLDVAAAPHNAKCKRFYTRADDGLTQPWSGQVWCNPPYSRVPGVSDLGSWVQKAWSEWGKPRTSLIVMLVPANRVEQAWWQDWIEPERDRPGSPLRVEFLRGRLRFDQPAGWQKPAKGDRPPFGCALLIWQDPSEIGPPPARCCDLHNRNCEPPSELCCERWAESDDRCPECFYGPATGDLIAPCARHRVHPGAMLDALIAQAKAEALRSQRDFFAAIDMPVAADHCEQAAIAYDHSRAIALDVRTPPGMTTGGDGQ